MKSSRLQKVLNHFPGLLLFAFIFVNALSAFAGPGKTTYQAKIVKPDGYPLEVSSVNFKFTILDPAGSCILYSETYSSVNMSSTGGLISFALGSGVKTYPVSATTFEQVFSNITPSLSCDTGGPANYSPTATDTRKIVMQFHDGTGWQTLPAMSINAVPYAMYANEATKLNGLTSSDFVQVSTVPTCAASEALRYTGAGFTCVAVGNSVTSSTVVTALGYTPADGASLTTVTSDLSTVSSTVAGVSTYASSVSSTVFSVSSTVTSLQNSVAASFAAITSSQWTTSGTNIFYNTGNIGIGTTTPVTTLDVSGGVRIGAESTTCAPALAGTLRYNASNVEYCNGTSWQAFGVSGAGITNFNGSTSGTQSFATGTGGTAPNFNTSNGVHTLNIPLASTGSVTAGLLSNADYTAFTNKITSSAASIAQVLGYVPADNAASGTYAQKANNLSDLTNVATARTNLGLGTFATASSIDLGSASATGTLAIARLPAFNGDATIAAASNTIILANSGVTAGTYTKVTVDSKGRVTSGAQIASSDVTTALGYAPANSATTVSSQWSTSGTTINYMNGNVGIGTTNPSTTLEVNGAVAISGSNDLVMKASVEDAGDLIFRNSSGTQKGRVWSESGVGLTGLYLSSGDTTPDIHINNAGNVGVGITAPTAVLHLAAGTSSTASFKFTSGTLLTSTQAGTMEYDGTNFYLTDSTNTRRAIAANTNPGIYDNVSNINSTGNITMTPVGSVVVSSTTASTNSSTGALIVKGGLGVVGDIYTSGTIVTSSNIQGVSVTATSGMISPYIYGSTVSGGALTLDSTTHATKGNVLIAPNGSNVGIGISAPQQKLHLGGAGIFRIQDNDDTSPHGYLEFGVTTAGSWSRKGYIGMPGAASAELAIAADGAGTPIYLKNTTGTVMTVSGSDVGIGTTTPLAKLDVAGQAWFGVTNKLKLQESGDALSLQGTLATDDNQKKSLLLNAWGGNVGIGTLSPGDTTGMAGQAPKFAVSGGYTNLNLLRISGSDTGNTIYSAQSALTISTSGGANQHIILNPNGNVGIGTSAPEGKLEIKLANTTYNATITKQSDYGDAVYLTTNSNPHKAALFLRGSDKIGAGVESGREDAGTTWKTYLAFMTNNLTAGANPVDSIQEKMRITADGNVGIGTSTPGAKLDVVGTVNSSSHITQGTQQAYPLASWGVATSSSGAIIIKLPGGYSNYGMLNVEIDTYEYNTNGATKYYIGGHNWNGAWYNYTNQTIGNSNKKVRLGYKDGQYVIVIGDNTSSWYYGSVKLTKITNGDYYTSTINLNGTYTITQDAGAEVYDWISSDLNKSYFGTTNFSGNLNVAGDNYALFGPNSGWGATLRVGGNGGTATAHASIATTNGNMHIDALDAAHNSYINWYRGADFHVGKGDGATTLFIVRNGGNVGVGTASPGAKLDVVGDTRISTGSKFTWPNDGGGGGGDLAYIRYHFDEGGENGSLDFVTRNDADDDMKFIGGYFSFMPNEIGNGNVGIGTVSPSERLHVVGNLRVQGSTDCTLGNGAGGTNCSSDARLKENIKPIPYALEKIVSLKGVEFDWNAKSISHGRHDIGVIAQDVEKVFPSAVIDDKNTGYKKVDYAVLVAPLIQAVKELYKLVMDRFEDQDRQLASITEKAAKLEAENAALKKYLCSQDPAAPICK